MFGHTLYMGEEKMHSNADAGADADADAMQHAGILKRQPSLPSLTLKPRNVLKSILPRPISFHIIQFPSSCRSIVHHVHLLRSPIISHLPFINSHILHPQTNAPYSLPLVLGLRPPPPGPISMLCNSRLSAASSFCIPRSSGILAGIGGAPACLPP